jgi:2-hydroxy-3-oxopropionate reductase
VAGKTGIVFLIVPDTPNVEAAIFGKNGIAEGIKPGSIVVDMGSISPIATKEFARKLKAMGVEMLDAPVSGGQVGAQSASLSIMVGGSAEIFEKIRPYFEIMGKNIVLIGGNGDDQTCKVANHAVAR